VTDVRPPAEGYDAITVTTPESPAPAIRDAIFRDHPSALCLIRIRDLCLVAVNPAFELEIGRPAAELIGHRPDELGLVPVDEAARLLAEVQRGPPDGVVTRLKYVAAGGRPGVARLAMRLSEIDGEQHVLASFTDASTTLVQEEALGRRDAILDASGFAAQMFLRAERWEDAIEDVLRRLGEAAAVSRAHVFENVVQDDGAPGSTHRFEWCAPGVEPQIDNPDTIDQPWNPTQEEWLDRLRAGEPVAQIVRDLSGPERAEFDAQGIVSILDMPVFAGRQWWGTIGFDDCVNEREWTQAEIDALRVAASTLGSAIDRQRAERSLRETEELYRILVEQIPAAVYVNRVSEEYLPVYTSPGISELLGITPDEYTDGRLWATMIHRGDRKRVLAEDTRTDATLEPFSVEYRMVRPDGRTVWVLDQAEVVRDEHGQPRFWSGVMFDITNLKRAEEELAHALDLEREASARLRSIDELKDTFLQAVSHDLRTPLAAVLGSALTLERDDIALAPEEERDLIRRIAMNARKLQRLVTDLLDLDRLSRGLLEPRRVRADLADVVRTVIEESDVLSEREIRVEAVPTPVAVDVPKIERIVENLLVNAIRHTPAQAHIWVRVMPDGHGGRIAVEDDGPGVPTEDRDRLFRAFERGASDSEHAPGSGIGLTLVARFAELHGGRAWVEERSGGGASFVVWLPDDDGGEPGRVPAPG
jgi:PAS domain S-box-containing protein